MPSLFLSPSTQEYNLYVNGGTEEEYMNLIADAMEPYLRQLGIDFARNDPSLTVGGSVRLSNAYQPDLHLAIHSNASPEYLSGLIQGTDAFYYPGSVSGRAFSDIIAGNMAQVYPYPELVGSTPNENLYELRETLAPAALVEVAYHDNPEDAQWIKDNIDEIARALSQSVAQYFGLTLPQPAPPQALGSISTSGFSVNLRTEPNWAAPALGVIPNGAKVELLGESGGWYQVGYQGRTGYVNSTYII